MMLGAVCAMCLALVSGVPRSLATAMSTASYTLATTQAGADSPERPTENAGPSTAPPSAEDAGPPPEQTSPAPTTPSSAELAAEAKTAARGALLGIMVFDRQTGQVLVEHDAERRFTTASLVKVLIALDWMRQVAGNGKPPATEARRIKRMLSSSDDPTANELWMAAGGPGIVKRAINRMGLEHTKPPAEPGRWGDTLISAADMVRVYRYLMEEAPAAHREIVLDALRSMTSRGSDGYDQTFGIPDAAGDRPWAVKQGWSCCIDYRIRHTSGLVGPDDRYIVVVLTAHSLSTSKTAADNRTTAVTTAVLRALGP